VRRLLRVAEASFAGVSGERIRFSSISASSAIILRPNIAGPHLPLGNRITRAHLLLLLGRSRLPALKGGALAGKV
jgi:hypothetical protein